MALNHSSQLRWTPTSKSISFKKLGSQCRPLSRPAAPDGLLSSSSRSPASSQTSLSLSLSSSPFSDSAKSQSHVAFVLLFQMLIEREMGKLKEKRKEVAIPAARVSKRARVDGASSSTSVTLGNGGGVQESPGDVTSDKHSVLKKPPPPQASTRFIKAQGETPTGGCKWNFNLEEESPGGTLTLPPVPAGWVILESLPEERATLTEAMVMAMVRCFEQHRMVG